MSRLNRLRAISVRAVGHGAGAVALAAASCIKEKDSLVIVGHDRRVTIFPGRSRFAITVGNVTQTL